MPHDPSEDDSQTERTGTPEPERETQAQALAGGSNAPSLQTLLDHTPDIITVMDLEMRLIYLNRTFAPRKVADVLGYNSLDFIPERDHRVTIDAFSRALATGAVQHIEIESESGFVWETRLVPLKQDGRIVAVMGIGADVTQRRQLEEQRRQAHKLEAIGRITAGIAHNFNNMLTVILTNLRLVRPQTLAALEPRLRDAEHAAQRAADMVRELMAFARDRRATLRLEPTDLVEVATRTIAMCRSNFDDIDLQLEVEGDIAPASADAGRIEQALLNVLLNARDALEGQRNPAPRVFVLLDSVALSADNDSAPGRAARIRVQDNGPGLTEPLRGRVFEPFFTTKKDGGTGLGLATAYGTMADHGGTITCDSQPGAGATFTLQFPVRA